MLGLPSHLHTFLSSFVETHGLNLMLKNGAVKHDVTGTIKTPLPSRRHKKGPDSILKVAAVLEWGEDTNLIHLFMVEQLRCRVFHHRKLEGEGDSCLLKLIMRSMVGAVPCANLQILGEGALLCVSVAGEAWRGSRDARASHWWGGWTDTPTMPSGQEGPSVAEQRGWERDWAHHLDLQQDEKGVCETSFHGTSQFESTLTSFKLLFDSFRWLRCNQVITYERVLMFHVSKLRH